MDKPMKHPKNPHAVALGKRGARARQEKLSDEQKSEIARNAVNERWRRYRARKAAELAAAKPRRGRKAAA